MTRAFFLPLTFFSSHPPHTTGDDLPSLNLPCLLFRRRRASVIRPPVSLRLAPRPPHNSQSSSRAALDAGLAPFRARLARDLLLAEVRERFLRLAGIAEDGRPLALLHAQHAALDTRPAT